MTDSHAHLDACDGPLDELLRHAEEAAGHPRALGWTCEVAPMWGGDTEAKVAIPGVEE